MTRRILITGAHGFLGSHLVAKLSSDKENILFMPSMNECDLTDAKQVHAAFQFCKPEIVYHLAARVGGIGANLDNPAPFWRDNLLMGINVLDACKDVGVSRLVLVGTTCSYPKVPATIPFVESELWSGYPEGSNAPYGIAKSTLIVGAEAYRKQYNLDTITLIPTNLFGPRDNFDQRTSHVIPALIKKFFDAKRAGNNVVTIWGTGNATRDFVFAPDVAGALVSAMTATHDNKPINVGSGTEITILAVAQIIADIVGYQGEVTFDTKFPDGQPRRVLNIERARKLLHWEPSTTFYNGIKATYDWYRTVVK